MFSLCDKSNRKITQWYVYLKIHSPTGVHFSKIFHRGVSRCQRLGLLWSVRNKPRAPKARDQRRRKTSGASLSPEARGFASQNRVFEHTRLRLCRPGVSIKEIIIEKRIKHRLFLLITTCYLWAPIVVDIFCERALTQKSNAKP